MAGHRRVSDMGAVAVQDSGEKRETKAVRGSQGVRLEKRGTWPLQREI